jgi:hypothetical protein
MGLAQPQGCADNTFLQGAPASTMQAFAALAVLAAPLSLHAQPEKCAVYSIDCAAAASISSLLGVHNAPEGLLATGNPVGTPAFQTAHADGCSSRACFLMEELLACPLGDQDRW